MSTLRATLLALCLSVVPVFAADSAPVQLMPAASEVEWGDAISLQGPGVVVVHEKAGPAEGLAAKLFCQYVERRFGQKWEIKTAGDTLPAASLRIVLGQPGAFAGLDKLCKEQSIAIPDHAEAYALKVWSEGGKTTAVVAGRSGRSIFYGQDTLFQLFSMRQNKLAVQAASIRDWPTIPMRGRPHPHYQYFFKTENYDCMMSSRINFMDVRDGIYAFEPGAKLKHDELRQVIKDGRDRDLLVFAVVNCGVPASKHDAVIALFKEFLDMGCNAVWASFDDKGAGEDPRGMVNKLLALARQYNIGGEAIAVTPPKGDYQVVNTKFNREIVGIPGMEKSIWCVTSVPCAQDAADGEAIGLRVRPSWWHNWPRLPHPSLHAGPGSYVPVLDMADGWNHPSEKELKEAGKYVHGVLPWDGWQAQQAYLVPVIGWWSWRPEKYDRQALNRRVYDTVFGPGQVQTLAAFDASLNAIQDRFIYWSTETEYAPECPPRLKSPDARAATVAELRAWQEKLPAVREAALAGSLLSRQVLEHEYLDPMANEIKSGLAMATAPYPEYWWPRHQDQLLNAIYDKNTAKAEQLLAEGREKVLKDIVEVKKALGGNRHQSYIDWWEKRANATVADWQALLAGRQEELQVRIKEYSETLASTKEMIAQAADPPVQVGTGVWEKHNQVLAKVVPEPRETFWGDWIGGIHKHGDMSVAVFALAKHLRVNAGVHSELPVNIPLAGRRDRLALLVYVSDLTKDYFGLGYAKWRWSGYRAIRLLWGEQEIWKADLGIPRIDGEWFVVPLPKLPDDLGTLPLRLRVEDYRSAKNNLQIVYVGPMYLIELDRD